MKIDLPPKTTIRSLLTATEAYPALEQLFLGAQTEIWASFRIFDLRTRLRSEQGLRIGKIWFDLFAHTLSRGVEIRFVLADFDPICAASLHQGSWRTVRQFSALREVATGGKLSFIAARHEAQTGRVLRAVFWPFVIRRLRSKVAELNAAEPSRRARAILHLPGLVNHVVKDAAGLYAARGWPPPALYPATHHQKMATFDRQTLYIGGLDVNERRYDDPGHQRAARKTWHDVALITAGPHVADAQQHLETFLDPCTAPPQRPIDRPLPALIRTLSCSRDHPVALAPRSRVTEIEAAFLHLIASARTLIYFETQFLRHMRLARARWCGRRAGTTG